MPHQIGRLTRLSQQSTTALGIAMIALLWGGIAFHLNLERQTTIDAANSNTANLARAFSEYTARIIHGEDGTLVLMRDMLQRDPTSFEALNWQRIQVQVSDVILQYSIIDRNGKLVASSLGAPENMDLSDRAHYRAHRDSDSDTLFVGKPVIGRVSRGASIHLSRRLTAADGSFAGVIVASLDQSKLTAFYETIDVGKHGAVSLIGTDGYVRASRGFRSDFRFISNESALRKTLASQTAGSITTIGNADGTSRYISFRTVEGLPLVVTVGLSQAEVLAPYESSRLKYLLIGAAITLAILAAMALSHAARKKLNRVYESLRQSEKIARDTSEQLRTTLENIDEGIIMADAAGDIQVINRRFIELLELPEEWLKKPVPLKDAIAYLTKRGEFDGVQLDPEIQIALDGRNILAGEHYYERRRPNGVVLEVRTLELPNGSLVRTFSDITVRKQAEEQIHHLAHHDALTGLANRTAFKERMLRSFHRAQHHDERFALILFDLDRFKTINDTMGHPAGDAVLQETARRLKLCCRERDLVARLGGDEFAIIQAGMRTEDDAAHLAQRILQTMRTVYRVGDQEFFIGVSIGIAVAPNDGAQCDSLMAMADAALYRAKSEGGARYAFSRTDIPLQPEAA